MKRLLIISVLVLVLPFLIGASCGEGEPERYRAKLTIHYIPYGDWRDTNYLLNGESYDYLTNLEVWFKWQEDLTYSVVFQAWDSFFANDVYYQYYFETTVYLNDGDDKYLNLDFNMFWRIN